MCCSRMQFVARKRPGLNVLELCAISRHIATLSQEHSRWNNRLHGSAGSRTTPRGVRQDLKCSLAELNKRLLRLRREAVAPIGKHPELQRKFLHLKVITGIAEAVRCSR